MTRSRDRQALRLLTMIQRLRALPVEAVTRKEWLGVLRLAQLSVRELHRLDERQGYEVCNGLVMRSMRDGLPIPRENEQLDANLLREQEQETQ